MDLTPSQQRQRRAGARARATRSTAAPRRPASYRRTASTPSVHRTGGRCTRASDPSPPRRPRSDMDVRRWTLQSDGRRCSRCRQKNWGGAMRIVRTPAQQTSEAKDENASTIVAGIVSRWQPARKKFTFSGAAQEIHRSFTGFAQVDVLTGSRWHTTLETS